MRDIVISGAAVLDGPGRPAVTGDVATGGERSVALDGKAGPAHWVIAAGELRARAGL
jgi:hypothetical protein